MITVSKVSLDQAQESVNLVPSLRMTFHRLEISVKASGETVNTDPVTSHWGRA